MKSFKIQIPSLLENIRIVESFIDNSRSKYKISDDVYGNIMVAVTEAVNNAVSHGNQQESSKLVTMLVTFSERSIRFVIEDEGDGFDYQNLQDPTTEANLQKPGGRGIYLMKHLGDEVNFLKDGKAVELIFYL